MTMQEIDRLRGELGSVRDEMKALRASSSVAWGAGRAEAELHVEAAEAAVLAALQLWWAQGCRESPLEVWKDRIVADLTDAEKEALASRFKPGFKPTTIVAMAKSAGMRFGPRCGCTSFDDGSRFVLSSFAGGAAPGGAFSFVRCQHKKPDGSTEIIHYVRADSIADLFREAAADLRMHDQDYHYRTSPSLLARLDEKGKP